MRVVIHIDRLVLRGVRPEARDQFTAGLRQGLTRLFADPGAVRRLQAAGDLPRLDLGSVRIADAGRPSSALATAILRTDERSRS